MTAARVRNVERTRRGTRVAAFAGAVVLASCIELSAPTDGIESLSPLAVPYPAVIAGDTLRDANGQATPLAVAAYSGRGDPVDAPEGLQFIVADSGTDARIAGGYFIAGTTLGPVRVVAQVPGLQTPPVAIQVVPRPSRVRAEPAGTGDTVTLPVKQFALEASVTSAPMQVRVVGEVAGTVRDVNGWIVRYAITRQPEPVSPSVPAAYLAADQGRAIRGDSSTAIDTTAGGVAGRQVVLRPFLMRALVDTVIVEATVLLHGVPLPGSPVVFRVPFANAP